MDRVGVTTPVVVVTQFDRFGDGKDGLNLAELDAQLRHDHPNIYRGYVYYNVGVTGWREDLSGSGSLYQGTIVMKILIVEDNC